MTTPEGGPDFRGLSGQLIETPFTAARVSEDILKRLTTDRYAWLTTVAGTGIPTPTLVWFRFDGTSFTVYSHPNSARITHVFQHPGVSLHLESDGIGSSLVIVGGTAAVTAEGADPRKDEAFWAKYHVEAELTGLAEAVGHHSARITITPTTLWTTIAT
ncbi:MAG TPA: pyridoxamine 5'-phosphate oxidase family protein [Mycobacterium sp.]|nr:pyridoxamine 5'-phosphate oxidase family protein [Mycobacterium sp.]